MIAPMIAKIAQSLRPSLVFALALLASACGQDNSSPGPGPTSGDEARALREAAEMIDEARATPAPSSGNGSDLAAPDGPPQDGSQ